MADRRITTEIVQMDSTHQVESKDSPEDVEFQVPNIKRCLLGKLLLVYWVKLFLS